MDSKLAHELYPKVRDIRCGDYRDYMDALEQVFLEAGYHKLDKEKVAEIVDDVLTCEALIVLDLNREKVEAIKDWSDNQIQANHTLRETTIKRIINLRSTPTHKGGVKGYIGT